MEFVGFEKIARFSRPCTITEKIDGTNGQIAFDNDMNMFVGSRNRWITPEDDNAGFAKWCYENEEELRGLGEGRHFGEWWGLGIQRRYDMEEKVFSLFNTGRWHADNTPPECCRIVPQLWYGVLNTDIIGAIIAKLKFEGSVAAPGFMNPEGIIIYHHAARLYFKKTIVKDEEWKGKTNAS